MTLDFNTTSIYSPCLVAKMGCNQYQKQTKADTLKSCKFELLDPDRDSQKVLCV